MMTQFINKSIIKAEIERLIKEYKLSNSAEAKYRCEAYGELLEFINSLQDEPVSEDLEEASIQYAKSKHKDTTLQQIVSWDFKAGAQWKEEQCQKTIELAEDHAYLAGQEKIITKTCEWLSKVSIEDMTYKYDDFDTSEGWYKFIEDFKKAMEE